MCLNLIMYMPQRGSRIGMVPLFEGIVNYDEIIQEVRNTDLLLP